VHPDTELDARSSAGPDAIAVRRFVERFALLLTDAGWPRMPARVFACLLADEKDSLTAGELAARLSVSPAAVSGAVRYLVQLGLIVRDREPGSRSDHYAVDDLVWQRTWIERLRQLRRWQDSLTEGIGTVGPDSGAVHRLGEARRFFAFIEAEMAGVLDRWREQFAGG
jgi:DNA-binding MarR family transcriptional regulator